MGISVDTIRRNMSARLALFVFGHTNVADAGYSFCTYTYSAGMSISATWKL
jgi:cytochrome bd-type quinol oxidase subunit 1